MSERLTTCDKLRFLQKDFCNVNKASDLCKELSNTIEETNCPPCPLVHPTGSYKPQSPPPGCGIGIFVSKE